MAYANAELSSTLRALAAADKPLIVGTHRLATTGGTYQWRTTGSFASGSDVTDATGPVSYLSDLFIHLRSKPSSAATTHYLILDFGASGTSIDSIAIINHNFGTIGGLTVTFEIADSNSYASNLIELASWSPGTSTKRLTDFTLDHSGSSTSGASSREYTAVRYARLKMTKGSSFTPEIGEIILGTRRQLKAKPNVPYDSNHLKTYGVPFVSSSRVKTFYTKARGQKLLDIDLTPWETSYINDLTDLFESDTSFGRRPWLWVEDPTTSPQKAYLMNFLDDPELAAPVVGPFEREFKIVAEEQGPQFVKLEA